MTAERTRRNKVTTVIDRYGLSGLETELERRWTGDGYEAQSVRELTTFFNQRVLRAALSAAGEMPLDGEVENLYRLLTADEVRSGEALQARERLGRYGVDPDDVEGDFVSHQTMYRFLRDVRDIDTSPEEKTTAEIVETTRQSLLRLNSRTKSVATQHVDQLDRQPDFDVGSFDVFVTVQVACSDCGTTREITQLLEERGCACRSAGEE